MSIHPLNQKLIFAREITGPQPIPGRKSRIIDVQHDSQVLFTRTGSVVDVAHRAFGQAQDLQIILARIVILNERLLVEVKIGWSGATSAAQSQQQAAEAAQLFESHFSLIPNPNVEREKIVETPRFFFWFEPSKWTPIRHDESLLSAQL